MKAAGRRARSAHGSHDRSSGQARRGSSASCCPVQGAVATTFIAGRRRSGAGSARRSARSRSSVTRRSASGPDSNSPARSTSTFRSAEARSTSCSAAGRLARALRTSAACCAGVHGTRACVRDRDARDHRGDRRRCGRCRAVRTASVHAIDHARRDPAHRVRLRERARAARAARISSSRSSMSRRTRGCSCRACCASIRSASRGCASRSSKRALDDIALSHDRRSAANGRARRTDVARDDDRGARQPGPRDDRRRDPRRADHAPARRPQDHRDVARVDVRPTARASADVREAADELAAGQRRSTSTRDPRDAARAADRADDRTLRRQAIQARPVDDPTGQPHRTVDLSRRQATAQAYPRPERFDPERWTRRQAGCAYTWLPFGGGIRRCIGMAFAQFEMRIVLQTRRPAGAHEARRWPGECVTRRSLHHIIAPAGAPVSCIARKADAVPPPSRSRASSRRGR